jgi:hypothetical protein
MVDSNLIQNDLFYQTGGSRQLQLGVSKKPMLWLVKSQQIVSIEVWRTESKFKL